MNLLIFQNQYEICFLTKEATKERGGTVLDCSSGGPGSIPGQNQQWILSKCFSGSWWFETHVKL